MAAALLCVVGLMGFAHTDAGRPLLALLAAAQGGCPIDPVALRGEAAERYRQQRLLARAGQGETAGHPALHFELGVTRRSDVVAWLGERERDCRAARDDMVLKCVDLAVDEGPMVDDLLLQFDGAQRLVAVDLFRAGDELAASLRHFEVLDEELAVRVGPATEVSDGAGLRRLRAGAFGRASRRYRYSNYEARVSVMQYGKRGVRVREQYQWTAPQKQARR
jgi:hypothetical protein